MVSIVGFSVELGGGFQRDSPGGFASLDGEGVVVIVDPFVFCKWLFGPGVIERALLDLVGFRLDAAVGIAVIPPPDFHLQIQHPTSIMNQII